MDSAKCALGIVVQHHYQKYLFGNQQDTLELAECEAAKEAKLDIVYYLTAPVVFIDDAMRAAEISCWRWVSTHDALKAHRRVVTDYAAVSIAANCDAGRCVTKRIKLSANYALYATLRTILSTGSKYVTAQPEYATLRTALCAALNTAKDAAKDAADANIKNAKDAKAISASAAKAAAKDAKDAKILANKLGTKNALYVANRVACFADCAKYANIRCEAHADNIIVSMSNPTPSPYAVLTNNTEAFAAIVSEEAKKARVGLASLSNDTYDDYAETNYASLAGVIANDPTRMTVADYIAHDAANAKKYWANEAVNELHLAALATNRAQHPKGAAE